jgi:ubiquinone/menaquinone biosynthesis C-methylase UbiE
MNHIDQLLLHVPDLHERKILDLGSGKGGFLIEATKRGLDVSGIEYNPAYIDSAKKAADEEGIVLKVLQGRGEEIPFEDASFDFVNISEVIEHVESPEQVLAEVYRISTQTSKVYMSVPARFSMRDPHYKWWGINWMPRSWSAMMVHMAHRARDAVHHAGAQTLSEMHYFTLKEVGRMLTKNKFSYIDIREAKIRKRFKGVVLYGALAVYYSIRPFYFDTFHLLLTKNDI